MKPKTFMLNAGEASGDLLAAELVQAIRAETGAGKPVPTTDRQPLHTSLEPRFFGAGGALMTKAGVKLALDMTEHSVTGLSDVLKNYLKFRRIFRQLYRLALDRQPDAIICVDFSGFNRRFAHAIKEHVRKRQDWFHDWRPKLIQYVSPQVWASRETRAYQIASDYDLLLSIFPFEKEWYAKRVPELRVDFVGHPVLDRYVGVNPGSARGSGADSPMVLLLPGSRPDELARHVPVTVGALKQLQASVPGLRSRMVLPNENLAELARDLHTPDTMPVEVGGLSTALAQADLAIASTGTVTLECAYFGVPTVALYKTSWSTYQLGKWLVKVKFLAMPNLLANQEVFPEFIQNAATADNLAKAGLALLRDEQRRANIKAKLAQIVAGLGQPGAGRRAAHAICSLVAG